MNDVGTGQTETDCTIRVALIDDHKVVLDMTRAVLEDARSAGEREERVTLIHGE